MGGSSRVMGFDAHGLVKAARPSGIPEHEGRWVSRARAASGSVPFLAKQRNVIGWGSEGVGTDAGRRSASSPRSPATAYAREQQFGLASLANLDQLPPKGSLLITPPFKIVNGSGSPCRVLALVAA